MSGGLYFFENFYWLDELFAIGVVLIGEIVFLVRLSQAHSASRDEGRGVLFVIVGINALLCVVLILILR